MLQFPAHRMLCLTSGHLFHVPQASITAILTLLTMHSGLTLSTSDWLSDHTGIISVNHESRQIKWVAMRQGQTATLKIRGHSWEGDPVTGAAYLYYSNCRTVLIWDNRLLAFSQSFRKHLGDRRDVLEQVPHDTISGHAENRCFFVLVDRDNDPGGLHPHQVLDGTGNPTGNI